MFKFEFKGVEEESSSPVLLMKCLKEYGFSISKVKLYRNDEVITIDRFNYYLELFKTVI